MSVNLAYREYGSGPPLMVLHGLFGSAANWGRIARGLADHFRVLCVDLRNHGRSPHDPDMSYADMVGDVRAFLAARDLECASILGHSMGGKVAMLTALEHPECVDRLIVVDIAPVRHRGARFAEVIDAMLALDTAGIENRAAADECLRPTIPNDAVRAFVLTNLVRRRGTYMWRLNLPAIRANLEDLLGFPELPAGCTCERAVLFAAGEDSDYLAPATHPVVRRYFPNAWLCTIRNAGHWLHVDAPEAFTLALGEYLDGRAVDLEPLGAAALADDPPQR